MKNLHTGIIAVMAAAAFGLSGCGGGGDNVDPPTPVQKTFREQYAIADIVKEDNMMFDTALLFAAEVGYFTVDGTVPDDYDENEIAGIKYDGEPYRGKATHIFAYLGFPTESETLVKPAAGWPAVVLVHGAGDGHAHYEWVRTYTDIGYAAIAISVHATETLPYSNPLNRDYRNPDGGPTGYLPGSDFAEPDLHETWVYGSVANIIRANNLLRAHPDVDANCIGLSGISWGGYLALTAAGVDKRFGASSIVYSTGFIDETVWNPLPGTVTAAMRERFETYLDPMAYAPYITQPILFLGGTNDTTFSMHSRKQTSDLIPAKTFFSLRKSWSHGHMEGWNASESADLFNHIFANKDSILRVGEVAVIGDTAKASIRGEIAVDRIDLVYATGAPNALSETWSWESKRVSESDSVISTTIPEGTIAFFFQIKDWRQHTVSSDMIRMP
jgi:dienelactone hydrolase